MKESGKEAEQGRTVEVSSWHFMLVVYAYLVDTQWLDFYREEYEAWLRWRNIHDRLKSGEGSYAI